MINFPLFDINKLSHLFAKHQAKKQNLHLKKLFKLELVDSEYVRSVQVCTFNDEIVFFQRQGIAWFEFNPYDNPDNRLYTACAILGHGERFLMFPDDFDKDGDCIPLIKINGFYTSNWS